MKLLNNLYLSSKCAKQKGNTILDKYKSVNSYFDLQERQMTQMIRLKNVAENFQKGSLTVREPQAHKMKNRKSVLSTSVVSMAKKTKGHSFRSVSPHDGTDFIYHENNDTRNLPVHDNSIDLFRMDDSNVN